MLRRFEKRHFETPIFCGFPDAGASGGRHRHFRVSHRVSGETYVDPDTWYLNNASTEGSWWPLWAEWLERNSSGRAASPPLGAPDRGYPPLGAAPGRYVFER
jgi:polyhydroxyalkanoate synthase